MKAKDLLEKLMKEKSLTKEEFVFLLEHREEVREEAKEAASVTGFKKNEIYRILNQ